VSSQNETDSNSEDAEAEILEMNKLGGAHAKISKRDKEEDKNQIKS
jgi:hypothetical protein